VKTKIDIGIDIGNEFSAIARMQNGEPVVVKSHVLKETLPTCVHINKRGAIQVGDVAFNAMKKDKLKAQKRFETSPSNSFVGFLRTIGTDKKYYSSNLDKEFTSEELIAEIIKELKSFISDEEVNSTVIAIPAKYTINQKDAIIRAGELAGLKQVELLQEPIAAAMSYGLDAKSKDGYWLVFDFGGGTFDAALLKVEDGIMKVIDTEGDNYLGGKNLDYGIVDDIIMPHIQENFKIDSILSDDRRKHNLLSNLKFYSEETIKQMYSNDRYNIFSDIGDFFEEDDKGNDIEIDIEVIQEMMQNTLAPIFQKSIDICKYLLKRNSLNGNLLNNLILVGEPTYSPILRKMLEEQITKPDTSIDPITAIVKGAALYASTIDVSNAIREQQRDKTKIQLGFGYEATTVEEELKDVFYCLEETNKQFGNDKTNEIVEQFKEQIPEIIKEKNVKVAQEIIDNMRQFDFALVKNDLSLNEEDILNQIDILKTELIDNLEENENLTNDVFTELFNSLFNLEKEMENKGVLNEYLSIYEDIKLRVNKIIG